MDTQQLAKELDNNQQQPTIILKIQLDGDQQNNENEQGGQKIIKVIKDSEIVIERDADTNYKIINGFMLLNEIGKGSWSKVKLCVDVNSGEKYAFKKFHKGILQKKTKIQKDEQGNVFYKSQWENVEQEIQIMKTFNHSNVTLINSVIHHDSQSKLYLIIDYCEHGDVLKWNEKTLKFSHINIPEANTVEYLQKIMLDCCLGLKYMHDNNIIHRDIKPQNILVTKDLRVKICDFGLAIKLTDDQRVKGTEGTYHFMAPESLSDSEYKTGFDGKKADIWSLGITFYCMVYLKLPFYHDNLMQLFQMIQSKDTIQNEKIFIQKTINDPPIKYFSFFYSEKNVRVKIFLFQSYYLIYMKKLQIYQK